jgi:hypothetical protein
MSSSGLVEDSDHPEIGRRALNVAAIIHRARLRSAPFDQIENAFLVPD